MPDCDYCGESFGDEAEYMDHLESVHEDELGRIDSRRVAARDGSDGGGSGRRLLAGVALAAVLGFLGVSLAVGGVPLGGSDGGANGSGGDAVESQTLPDRGDESLLERVERFPSEGTEHVSQATAVEYSTTPPTSGPHYDRPAEAGFYEETPAAGHLVHSLEHGAVVVYYDPDALTTETRESLQAWADAHTDPWASVIVAPHPVDDPESPYVLTAWRTRLVLDGYDAETVQAFLAEFLGRGPEHPVR